MKAKKIAPEDVTPEMVSAVLAKIAVSGNRKMTAAQRRARAQKGAAARWPKGKRGTVTKSSKKPRKPRSK